MKISTTTQLLLLLLLVVVGCVQDPVVDENQNGASATHGVIIINEGLWRQDNSTLTLYNRETDNATTDWFALINRGERLGDTGNEIVVRDSIAWIVVSESSTIEKIELPSGRSLGRLRLPSDVSPRSITFLNDTLAWVSCLDDDAVYRWNPASLTWDLRRPVGPAPEGIAVASGRLFVANSGLGALRGDEPGAGTVLVLDPVTGEPEGSIPVGGNLDDLHLLSTDGLLYLFVGAALPDTSGSGIVAIDPITLRIQHRWSVSGAWAATFDDRSGEAWLIAEGGIIRITLPPSGFTGSVSSPVTIISQTFSTLDNEVPHSIGIAPDNGQVYIGYARGYFQGPGRVDRYSREGVLVGSFIAGVNPVAIGFY